MKYKSWILDPKYRSLKHLCEGGNLYKIEKRLQTAPIDEIKSAKILRAGIRSHNIKVVKLLLENKATVVDEKYQSILDYCLHEYPHPDLFDLLVEHGASLTDVRILDTACLHNRVYIVKRLVSLGVRLEPLLDKNNSLLYSALLLGYIELTGYLLDLIVSICGRDYFKRMKSPLIVLYHNSNLLDDRFIRLVKVILTSTNRDISDVINTTGDIFFQTIYKIKKDLELPLIYRIVKGYMERNNLVISPHYSMTFFMDEKKIIYELLQF